MKKIFIIIVSYNGGQKIIKTVRSIAVILERNENSNLVIIDNASTDKSVEKIKKILCPFKLIQNKKNLGFAKGANQGIRHAIRHGANRILLVNQDLFIKDKDFKILIKNQSKIVGPIVKFKRNNKLVYDIGGKLNWRIMRPYHLEKLVKPGKSCDIDYISGCCMLIDSSVFKKIGFFDEKFFLYFEDVDFCLRASEVNFDIGVEPKAIAFHDLAEGEQKSINSIYSLIKSHLTFINKWTVFPTKITTFFYWFFISFKMLIDKLVYTIAKL